MNNLLLRPTLVLRDKGPLTFLGFLGTSWLRSHGNGIQKAAHDSKKRNNNCNESFFLKSLSISVSLVCHLKLHNDFAIQVGVCPLKSNYLDTASIMD